MKKKTFLLILASSAVLFACGPDPVKPVNVPLTSIEITGPVSVRKTEQILLTINTEPANASNKAVNWTSSDSSIATVSVAGYVYGVEEGDVIITATSKENPAISDTYQVLVTPTAGFCDLYPDEPECQPRTNVYVAHFDDNYTGAPAPTEVTLIGEGKTLTQPANPSSPYGDTFVHWSKNRNEVAFNFSTILNKDMTFDRIVEDNNNAKVEYHFTLYAVWQIPGPTSLTISGEAVVEINRTIKLTVTANPFGTNNAVTWSSSDASIATVSSMGEVKGIAAGNATITATSTANANIKATKTINVTPIQYSDWTVVGAGSFINGGAEWSVSSGVKMVVNTEYVGDGKEYMATVTFKTNDLFKLTNGTDWITSGWETADADNNAFTKGLIMLVSDGLGGDNVKVLKDCRLSMYFKVYTDKTYSCWIQPAV